MAFIRPFQPSDSECAKHICRSTLPPKLAASEAAHRIAPYVWTLQYTHLRPQNCFVVDDGAGRAVGYVIGCPDVHAFAAAYPRYVAEVLRAGDDVPEPPQLTTLEPWEVPAGDGSGETRVNDTCMAQLAYNVRWLLLEGVPGKAEMVGKYRATMHIDLLPEFQGQGWGRRLIERFVEGVRQAVVEEKGEDGQRLLDCGKGIHIGVSGQNTKVLPFYDKLNFKIYEGGEKEGNVWLTRDVSVD